MKRRDGQKRGDTKGALLNYIKGLDVEALLKYKLQKGTFIDFPGAKSIADSASVRLALLFFIPLLLFLFEFFLYISN